MLLTNCSEKWLVATMMIEACIIHGEEERQVEFKSPRQVGTMTFTLCVGGWGELPR